jgi:uncharacterized damage-inducible protein DinB
LHPRTFDPYNSANSGEVDVLNQLLEAWPTNNRINLFLIDHISAAGMKCTLSERGGREVGRQFAHLHDVRVYHLEKRAKDLAEGLKKFQSKGSEKTIPTKTELRKAFATSSKAVETYLGDVLSGAPKRRGFKKGIFTTLGYFIAHESHHRGSILLTLKQSGHKLDNATAYAIWAWDQI